MDSLFFYLAPAIFGFFVGAFSTVGPCQDFQAGRARQWRVLVPWVLSTITGVIYVGLLRALAKAVDIGPEDPANSSRVLAIFVSCLAGSGLGGLYVMRPVFRQLALGWRFIELFADLKTALTEQELRVLLVSLTPDPRPDFLTRIWCHVRRRQPLNQRERLMKELGIHDIKAFNKLLASALRKYRDHFRNRLDPQ